MSNKLAIESFPSLAGDVKPPVMKEPIRKAAVAKAEDGAIDWNSIKVAELACNGHVDVLGEVDISSERQPSILLRKKAKRLRENASKAYEVSNHSRANAFSAEASALDSEAHVLQIAASNRIFLSKNSSIGVTKIDLHGLFAEEALERLEHRLSLIIEKLDGMLLTFELEVITGWGKGQSGRAILRPAVEAWLRECAFHFVEKFPGHFFVVVRRSSFDSPQA
jgi:DNA-nicking Smr family endonuclease